MKDEDITKGFIGENGIDVYMIEIVTSKIPSNILDTYPKNVIFLTLTQEY